MNEDFLAVAKEAAQAAGKIIAEDYHANKDVNYKEDNSPVTETDKNAEQAIVDVIKAHFPDHAIFAEERGWNDDAETEYIWVIDPLDGTGNFVKHIPFFCTSIALTKNGKPIVGVIYAPVLDEMFAASVDQDATLNNEKISAPTDVDLAKAVAGFGSRSSSRAEGMKVVDAVTNEVRTLRVLGSFALHLCYLAAGRLDLQVAVGVDYYDAAAGALIARQAGAKVTNFSGEEWQPAIDGQDSLLAASPQVHQKLLDLVASL